MIIEIRTPAIFRSFLHLSSQARSAGGPNFPPVAAFPFVLACVAVRAVLRLTRPPPWDTAPSPNPSDIKAVWPSSITRSLRSRRSSKASAGSSTVSSETEGFDSTYSYIALYNAATVSESVCEFLRDFILCTDSHGLGVDMLGGSQTG
jgi:hypothetical protein